MFRFLGSLAVRRPRAVLATYAVAVIAAFAVSTGLFGSLKTQGYDNPDSDSATVESVLTGDFRVESPSVVIIVDSDTSADDPSVASHVAGLEARLAAEDGVRTVVSYWSLGRPAALRSADGKAGLVNVYFAGGLDPEQASATAGRLQEAYDTRTGSLRVYVGGLQTVYHAINQRIKSDLTKAEAVAVPLNILLLLVVFGTANAAGLPMIVALAAIAGSYGTLLAVTQQADVSVFALNLVTGLSLGLGIDYALLIVNRFREELHGGKDAAEATVRTIMTAGRTVVFSAAAVMLVIASMGVFPQYFLQSFAYAGVSVVFFAAVASVTALPAALYLMGPRIDKLRVRRGALTSSNEGAWAWVARTVMRRPLPVIVATLAALSILAWPAVGTSFGQVDDRVLQPSEPVAVAAAIGRERFVAKTSTPVEVLVPKASASIGQAEALANSITPLADVVSIATPTRVWQGAWAVPQAPPTAQESAGYYRITVVTDLAPREEASVDLVNAIRGLPQPPGTLVGGASAVYADSLAGISDNLPLVLGWLAVATLVVLFLYTGSVLLPIKAVALNVVSLAATLGMLTWVFQDGNAMWLVGDFTVTGTLDTSTIVLVAVVAFGLSMDYEVFMLSRIKEEHDRGASTVDAVSFGLQRSGRIITAAALLIAVVFATFVSSGVTSIKMLGLGTAFAILLDATVIRGLLVPALMRIAGRWNWWTPPGLRWVHRRFGITEG